MPSLFDGGTESNQSQTTTSTDARRVAGGDLISVEGTLNTGGGSLTIASANADVARAAIASVNSIANTTEKLAKGSNAIAQQVADSQAGFVEKASGQKTVIYVMGGALLVGAAYVFTRKKS